MNLQWAHCFALVEPKIDPSPVVLSISACPPHRTSCVPDAAIARDPRCSRMYFGCRMNGGQMRPARRHAGDVSRDMREVDHARLKSGKRASA